MQVRTRSTQQNVIYRHKFNLRWAIFLGYTVKTAVNLMKGRGLAECNAIIYTLAIFW